MQKPRPSNLLIRAFLLIFVCLAVFVFGTVLYNAIQPKDNPEELREFEHEVLK